MSSLNKRNLIRSDACDIRTYCPVFRIKFLFGTPMMTLMIRPSSLDRFILLIYYSKEGTMLANKTLVLFTNNQHKVDEI